jgi:hypothetical protein
MDKNRKITVAAILTLAIAGCATENVPPPPVTNVLPTAAPLAKSPLKAPAFPNPVVPAQSTSAVAVQPSNGLIQSTDPNLRNPLVQKGRPDPFAQIGVQAVPLPPTTSPQSLRTVPKLPPLPIPRQKPQPKPGMAAKPQPKTQIGVRPIKPNPRPNQVAVLPIKPNPRPNPVLPKVLPQVIPNNPLVNLLPPAGNPDLARSILVTGIVLIGKEPQAIIKVPDEPTSRYVQAGQRLVNGVLVKRIEMNEGSNPVVILEQYGIEVARMVGEGTANPKASTTTAAENSISAVTSL